MYIQCTYFPVHADTLHCTPAACAPLCYAIFGGNALRNDLIGRFWYAGLYGHTFYVIRTREKPASSSHQVIFVQSTGLTAVQTLVTFEKKSAKSCFSSRSFVLEFVVVIGVA